MRERHGYTEAIWGPEGMAGRGERPAAEVSPTDVVIVGAGIAGVTLAYLLAHEGRAVTVIDAGPIGGAETGRTSGHLASAIDEHFVELERMHGKDGARLAFESHAAAIDLVEAIASRESIACGFVRLPAYLLSASADEAGAMTLEVDAALRAGADASLVEGKPVGGPPRGPSVRYGNQARFEPMQYFTGLVDAARARGVRFVEQRIEKVVGSRGPDDLAQAIPEGDGPVHRAGAVVVATNTPGPIADWAGIHFKQAAYRSYVIGLRVPRDTIEDALYWDTAEPYHYARLLRRPSDDDGDVLVVGGEDHRVGQLADDVDPFAALEQWARDTFDGTGEVVARWSGQIQEPLDGLAFLGRAATKGENVYVITGDSGNGLTHATIGARLVADLVMGRENPWTSLYDPLRKPLHSLGGYARENLSTAMHLLGALTPGETQRLCEMPFGSAAVVREGLRKLAVYRDDAGKFHACSAVCPHLGAIVEWNAIERTWDCPAHGSRFGACGELLTGPAVENLDGAERVMTEEPQVAVG